MNCKIEHVESDRDVGMPCSNRAVAISADCGGYLLRLSHVVLRTVLLSMVRRLSQGSFLFKENSSDRATSF
jgi:hypothetical protein